MKSKGISPFKVSILSGQAQTARKTVWVKHCVNLTDNCLRFTSLIKQWLSRLVLGQTPPAIHNTWEIKGPLPKTVSKYCDAQRQAR
jgi:hypothetical protein